ncbi:MAG: cation:proton antiporter [Oscillospiraceae bacterium]|nr:cation:proton antiporter [Oscillospiraceae bacterium]
MELKLLFDFALILVATKLLGMFSRKMHLPQVVGALFAGILLGPAALGIIAPNEVLTVLAQVGVILLMFSAGLETDLNQIRRTLKPAIAVAFLGVLLPLGGGFAVGALFGQSTLNSVFIGVILTATSVSITVETLQEMGKLNTRVGATIMGAAVVDDILGLIILSAIMGFGAGDAITDGVASTITAVGITLLKVCGFFVFALVFGYCIRKLLTLLEVRLGHKKRVPILALAFCFFFAYSAEWFGVADIIGAYFAGLALCNSPAEKYIEDKCSVLSFMFFSPIFFVSIGLMTSFKGLNTALILFTAALLLVAVATKLAGCGLGALLCKIPKRESLQIGVGMISRGEVAIIVAAKGIAIGLMDIELFSGVIVVVIVTTLITPVLMKLAVRC